MFMWSRTPAHNVDSTAGICKSYHIVSLGLHVLRDAKGFFNDLMTTKTAGGQIASFNASIRLELKLKRQFLIM